MPVKLPLGEVIHSNDPRFKEIMEAVFPTIKIPTVKYGDDFDRNYWTPDTVPDKRCENCRYQSAMLSDKPGKLWCVNTAKHKDKTETCEEHWYTREELKRILEEKRKL